MHAIMSLFCLFLVLDPFGIEFWTQRKITIYFDSSSCSYLVRTHHLLKMLLFFLSVFCWPLGQTLGSYGSLGLYMGLQFCFINQCACFYANAGVVTIT